MSTAQELVNVLEKHYAPPRDKPPAGLLVKEITAPNSSRRADAIWVPAHWQERGRLIGYEVKVSRADVAAELADPTKADAWLQYCNQWWLLVSEPTIIEGFEIPEHWGVCAPPSGRNRKTLTIIKQAPELKPVNSGDGLATILSREIYKNHDIHERLQQAESSVEAYRERLREK